MTNLDRVQEIIKYFNVVQEENQYIIKKLEDLEQSIINQLEVKL